MLLTSGSNSCLRAGNICSAFSKERKAMKQLSGCAQGVLQGTPPERSSAMSSQHHKLLTDGTTWDVSVQDSNICGGQQNYWKEMNEMKDSSKELRSLSQRLPSLSSAPTKRRFVRLQRKTSEGSQWVWTSWKHNTQLDSNRIRTKPSHIQLGANYKGIELNVDNLFVCLFWFYGFLYTTKKTKTEFVAKYQQLCVFSTMVTMYDSSVKIVEFTTATLRISRQQFRHQCVTVF